MIIIQIKMSLFSFKTKSFYDNISVNIGVVDSIYNLPFKMYNYIKGLCNKPEKIEKSISFETPNKYESNILDTDKSQSQICLGHINPEIITTKLSSLKGVKRDLFSLINEDDKKNNSKREKKIIKRKERNDTNSFILENKISTQKNYSKSWLENKREKNLVIPDFSNMNELIKRKRERNETENLNEENQKDASNKQIKNDKKSEFYIRIPLKFKPACFEEYREEEIKGSNTIRDKKLDINENKQALSNLKERQRTKIDSFDKINKNLEKQGKFDEKNNFDCKINFTNFVRFPNSSYISSLEDISRKSKYNEIKQNKQLSNLVEDKFTHANQKLENLNDKLTLI